jgi:hypothetical protein
MHCSSALCSLSIGSSVEPFSATVCMNKAPDMTSASLFASNTRFPLAAAASVGSSPADPTMAAIT